MADADVDDLFKRKKRGIGSGRKRKRPRHAASDWNDETEISKVITKSRGIKQQSTVKEKPTWKRIEYGTANKDNAANAATAERRDIGGGGKMKSNFGPRGAPTNVRVSIRIDYQPDVCKDYKETGYCGFGDACKFLHDRSDYKAGWQLEKDWATKQKLRQERILRGEDPDAEPKQDDDELPFACHICREKFKRPVETLCLHYFCEDCILNHMKSDSTCPVCSTQLRGTLNTAHRLMAKIAR